MSEILSVLIWLLALNLWVALGGLVLSRAIDKAYAERPLSVVHAMMWMCAWPLLLIRLLRLASLSGAAPADEQDLVESR